MEQIGTLSSIVRYPVKSMAGEDVASAFVGFAGVLGDRAYAFVRGGGVKGFPWLTIREVEDLVKFRARYVDPAAIAQPIDLQASLDLAPGVEPQYPEKDAFAVEVETPDGARHLIEAAELKALLEQEADDALTLRFSERAMTDCRPVSIFSNASAEALGRELGMPIDRRRFRANFYVDWAVAEPYYEKSLVGSVLQIGDRVKVMMTDRDPRCKIITVDPQTGEDSPKVLRHVTEAHEGTAGVYGAVLLEGLVKAGDPIYVL